MEGDGSPLSSLCMVRAAELFPKPALEKEDEKLKIPLTELAGEAVKYLGHTDDGVLALSNYRLFLLKTSTSSETSVPLGLIESATTRDLFHLVISCKDASTVKCSFSTSEQCAEWQRRILLLVGVPNNLESLFAFSFYAWASEYPPNTDNEWADRLQKASKIDEDFRKEVKRLEFDINGTWRISQVNADFNLCPSYPRLMLVPCCISDETLQNVATFRSSRRIPAVVWRHKTSGAVIARCSQPEVGWLGWRNAMDEQLLKALADACAFDKGEQRRRHNFSMSSDSSVPSSPEGSHEEVILDEVKKILIVDARSYTSAVTNRARGGGCECPDYYPCAEIQFMSLGNIHVIRKSFHALRQLCASPPDIPNWLSLLERTTWLQHMAGLLAASMTVCHAIEKNGRPVLVHCSDGWDRTPQIVATAQLCLDPYYRTVEGFRTLVEREWLSFGHKFADRCGHGPGSDELNERCPVFLQWLDCVHQIHKQFPCSFEFSMGYLIKLAQHSHSCIFGTFLCNTVKERIENAVFERTFSVWPFLSAPIYKNPLYVPNRERVLWPAHNVRDMALWSEVYLGSLGNQNSSDYPPNTNDVNQESKSPMIKTRSYGDLMTAGGNHGGLIRRSSDPNMTAESHFGLHHSSDPSIETMSDCGLTTDIIDQAIANYCSDTTKELDNLTEELKSDSELEFTINKINNINDMQIRSSQQQQLSKNQQYNGDVHSSSMTKHLLCDAVDGFMMNGINGSNDGNVDYDDRNILPANNHQRHQQQRDHSTSPFYTHLNQNVVENNFNNFLYNENLQQESIKNATNVVDNVVPSASSSSTIYNNHQQNHVYHQNGNSNDCTDGASTNSSDDVCNELMLHSVNLDDTQSTENSPINGMSTTQNIWHGNIETSTDTLVPIEQQQPNNSMISNSTQTTSNNGYAKYVTEDELTLSDQITEYINNSNSNETAIDNNIRALKSATTTAIILPEVHGNGGSGGGGGGSSSSSRGKSWSTSNSMDESILIQPEHQRMEILNGGRMVDTVSNIISTTSSHRRRRNSSNSRQDISPNKQTNGSVSPTAPNSRFSTPGARSLPLTPPCALERPSNAISCPDGLAHALSEQNLRLQQIVYEHKLREEALQRELYATRLALMKTTNHCNAQQIPDDPEDVLNDDDDDDEDEDFKLKYSPYNSRSSSIIDRQSFSPSMFYSHSVSSFIDNIENASVCSWEAVEDRGVISSMSGSQASGSVLWVPDHAVSRCTSCQTEFWLGRRKHHCRSCGQIFCADCSEFWAALPDERLYQPVRLCGSCYHAVTTKIQLQQHNRNLNLQQSVQLQSQSQQLLTSSSTNNIQPPQQQQQLHLHQSLQQQNQQQYTNQTLTSTSTVSSMEPSCKHAASSTSTNDRGPQSLKATAATN